MAQLRKKAHQRQEHYPRLTSTPSFKVEALHQVILPRRQLLLRRLNQHPRMILLLREDLCRPMIRLFRLDLLRHPCRLLHLPRFNR